MVVGLGSSECGSFNLNAFAIKEVWKLWMNLRVSTLQTADQIADRERKYKKKERAETELYQLIQSLLNNERIS